MDLPTHPEADDTTDVPRRTSTSRTQWLVVGIVVAALAVLVILHLSGVVGPGS